VASNLTRPTRQQRALGISGGSCGYRLTWCVGDCKRVVVVVGGVNMLIKRWQRLGWRWFGGDDVRISACGPWIQSAADVDPFHRSGLFEHHQSTFGFALSSRNKLLDGYTFLWGFHLHVSHVILKISGPGRTWYCNPTPQPPTYSRAQLVVNGNERRWMWGFWPVLISCCFSTLVACCFSISWHVMTCQEISWDFMRLLWDFMRFHDIAWDFMRCLEISWDFLRFLEISWDFMRFLQISWYFIKFHEISWHVLRFPEISYNAMRSHDMSRDFINVHGNLMRFHGISWYFFRLLEIS